jgi:hypothetical protein
MRLLDPDLPGHAQFFLPTKIQTIRKKQKQIELQNIQKQTELVKVILQKDSGKQKRLREKEERRDVLVSFLTGVVLNLSAMLLCSS